MFWARESMPLVIGTLARDQDAKTPCPIFEFIFPRFTPVIINGIWSPDFFPTVLSEYKTKRKNQK